MTFKEIWKKFAESVKANWKDCKAKISKAWDTAFKAFADLIVTLLLGLRDIVKSLADAVLAALGTLIMTVWNGLVALISSTIVLAFDYIIEKVKKIFNK